MEEASENKAVERLGAHEHLDRVLYVTTPKAWLALCALVIMLAAVVAWAILGEVSTYVEARGIILSRGGAVVDVTSPADARLSRILPGVGAAVSEGELVAELFDAGTMERHASAIALAEEAERTLKAREAEAREENAMISRNVARRRARLEELERTGRELVETIRKRLEEDRALLARGVANRTTVENGEQALDLAQRNLIDTMRRRDEMEAEDLRRRYEINARITEAKTEHIEAARQVSELEALLDTWRIRAPVSGRVTEIKAQAGATLEPDDPILSIETGEEDIDILFYASPADGKRIEAGMAVLVSPATVKREEFGSMIGKVESRSEFPMSLEGMVAALRNARLADTFSGDGPPYPGRVTLTPDPSTTSGFAWTSPRAADLEVTPGTLAEIEIKVSGQPPVSLLVPWLKEKFDF